MTDIKKVDDLPGTIVELVDEDLNYQRYVDNDRKLTFAADKHAMYFKMCLNILPSEAQLRDSSKIALCYFGILGLCILNKMDLVDKGDLSKRKRMINWIYQHYKGTGFRGSLTHCLSEHEKTTSLSECPINHASFDPPTLPSTYFGLCVLLMLQDNSMTARIDRLKIMRYVKKCQLENGAFAPMLDIRDQPFGDTDMRMCYVACAIRQILKIDELSEELKSQYDINVPKLVKYIESCQSYEGGFSGNPQNELHAGYTYCAIASLKLLGFDLSDDHNKLFGLQLDKHLNWLMHRQYWLNENNLDDFNENELLSFSDLGGFNGRENKISDTCYAFWVTGSLKILKFDSLIHKDACDYYLLNITQNTLIGGFGKNNSDDKPDLYHSSLGVAALKMYDSECMTDFEPIDAELLIPKNAKDFKDKLHWNSSI